jgi:hypothetical protein
MSQGEMTFSVCSYLSPIIIGMSLLSYPCARQMSRNVPLQEYLRGGKAAVLRDAKKWHFIFRVDFELLQRFVLLLD